MAPLFTGASFASITRPSPTNVVGNPPNASDAVGITLSDGSTIQVFDQLETALKCMEYMRQRSQWMLQASDDVAIVSVGATKLLILEMSLLNQKLLASFSPSYVGGRVLLSHRTLSQSLTLDDALQAVGYAKLSTTPWAGNFDLTRAPSPGILIVDWYFLAGVSSSSQGSQLADATPIQYDFT